MKLASVDIGSNTVRFLLLEASAIGEPVVLEDLAAITREGVDRTARPAGNPESSRYGVLFEELQGLDARKQENR